MHIDDYTFGRMTVDGTAYEQDVILLPGGGVHSPWWRRRGHHCTRADLAKVFDADPDVVVIGRGARGVMAIETETLDALRQAGIEVETARTADAADRYNELAATDRSVAGAFHLTC